MKKRILAMLLCVLMIVSLLPTWAVAEDTHDHEHEHAEEALAEETMVETPEEPAPAEEENDAAVEDDTMTDTSDEVNEEAEEPAITQEEAEEEPGTEEDEAEVEIQSEAQPVTVIFNLDPADTVLTVYTLNENDEKKIIEPEEDGSYLLLPGEYYYDAECEGYEPKKENAIAIDGIDTLKRIDVVLLCEIEDDSQVIIQATRPYSDLLLNINWSHIQSVGHQSSGQACACFAMAYLKTILQGRVRYWYEFNSSSPNNNQSTAICPWTDNSTYSGDFPTNKSAAFERAYTELCNGKPVTVKVTGSRSSHHYVTVVGFENVGTGSLSASNFLIIDPCASSFIVENLAGVGYDLKYEEGNYQVEYDTTSATASFTSNSTCTLTFDANGGTCSPSSMTVNKGNTASLPTPTINTVDPYAFDGWYTAKTGGTKVTDSTAINSSMTLYAHWTHSSLYGKINFDTDGGSFARIGQDEASSYSHTDYETGVVTTYSSYAAWLAANKCIYSSSQGGRYEELPVPTKTGYLFAGWYVSGGGNYKVRFETGFGGLNLVASWVSSDSAAPSYSLVYNGHSYELYNYNMSWTQAKAFCEAKGGHLVSITSQAEQNKVLELISGGADVNGPLNGVYYIGGTDAENEGTWKWVTGESFTYNNWDKTGGNEPSGGTSENYSSIMGHDYAPNKVVGEWVDSPDTDVSATTGKCYYSAGNCGFICEYEFDNSAQYTITYNANGGTGAPASQTKRSGQTITLSATLPSKNCHVFDGWATSSTATTAQYQPGDSYSADADLSLYAVWREGGYSEWSETSPTGVDNSQIETKTQYRYRDKETTTSTTNTMSGWTLEGSKLVWSDWGDWSNWSTTPVSAIDDSMDIDTETLYRYYYYYCPSCGLHEPYSGTCDNGHSGLVWHESWFPIPYSQSSYSYFSYSNQKCYTTSLGDGQRWCFSAGNLNSTAIGTTDPSSNDVVIKTGYRYRTRTQSTVYTFYRWGNWSDWSDTVYTASDSRQVDEPRTMYRIILDSDNVHSWDSGTITTQASCTTEGEKLYTCSLCGKTKTETIAALGHNLTAHAAVAATCTTAGNSAYWSCSRCNKYFSDATGTTEIAENSWVIAALGHNLTKHAAVAATCTTEGNSAYWSCSRCGKYFSNSAGTTKIAANSWVISALGHDWGEPTYNWATNNHSVIATRTCNRDSSHVESETGSVTRTVIPVPTCTEAGRSIYTATFTNTAFTKQTKIVWDIPELGHDLTEHVAVAATCTTEGNSAYWSCSRCGKYFSDAAGTTKIAENSWVIAKLGHNLTKHAAVAATCTTAGNSEYWSCSRCGKYFSDAAGTTEIAANSWVIAALGHNLTKHAAVSATCTTGGNSAYWSCSRCGKYFSDAAGTTEIAANSWVIAALGHNLTAHEAVAASCTTEGNSEYWSCSRCNKYYSNSSGTTEIAQNSWVTAALGHNYENGFCTRCGEPDPDYVADTSGIITVSSVRGRPGDEVTVDISLAENPGIMALTLGLTYDNTKLSYIGFEDGGLTDWSVASKAVWLGNSNSTYNGVILKLKFKILENAGEGETAVTVTCGRGDMVDASENSYIPEINPGKVTIRNVVPGDMNGDGSVNAIDLVRLKRFIAGENVDLAGYGDCTGDGQVNAIDLVRLKRYIAGENVELH